MMRAQTQIDTFGEAAKALRAVVNTEHAYPQGRFHGQGIVICAGGARMLTCAWVTVNALRRILGCTLPIQLWHIGPRELGSVEAALFTSLPDIEVVDAADVRETWPARKLGGWELKAYALVHSRFEQVLLLDADNVPVIDPAALFALPEFHQTGTLAWPDVERLRADNPIWGLCGLDFQDVPAWESGQLVLDKARTWPGLQVALHMNMHSEHFYPLTDGDADTFHLGWRLAGQSWSMPPYPARTTLTGLYQRDFTGHLIFQHRTTVKWRLSGPNLRSEDFRFEPECIGFLDELRERWSGVIDALAPAAPADRDQEAEITAGRWWTLAEPGQAARLLELLPGNRVGTGASRDTILRWYVRAGELTFDGAQGALPPLIADPDGSWVTPDGVTAERATPERATPERANPDGVTPDGVTPDGFTPDWAAPLGRPPAQAPRTLRLTPTPEAGLDSLGLTALRLLERFARQPHGLMADAGADSEVGSQIDGDTEPACGCGASLTSAAETVVTLATLAQLDDIAPALQRARSRWWDRPAVLEVIDRAARRAAMGTSTNDGGRPGHEPLERSSAAQRR